MPSQSARSYHSLEQKFTAWLATLNSDELLSCIESTDGTKKAKVTLDFRFLFCGIGALFI